jgi:hypothetical protein
MAELNPPLLVFEGCCPDCGERRAVLPLPFPLIDDDFDWRARDFDSFRLFMMQELAHRYPGRTRWTVADMEVVIVELLAAALDRASHALDTVQAERYLDSARRPQSVRRLLKLIGCDAVDRIDPALFGGTSTPSPEQVELYWHNNPDAMEAARREGPLLTSEQLRMVTLHDHEIMLEKHPLVAHARARLVRSGAWNTIMVATLLAGDRALDKPLSVGGPPPPNDPNHISDELWKKIADFHRLAHLELPPIDAELTARRLLRAVIERYRMVGSEVVLDSAKAVPVTFTFSVRPKRNYAGSELKQALDSLLNAGEGGFFAPGRLGFGEDLFASTLINAVMAVEGVETVCLNRFKRVGNVYPDRVAAGFIAIADDEFVECMNLHMDPARGTYRILIDAGVPA